MAWRSGHGRLGPQDGRSAARARLDRVGASTCLVLSAERGASRAVAARRSRRRPRASKRHSCFSCFAPTDERGWSIGRAGRRFSGDRQGDWPAAPVSRNRRQRRPQQHLGSLSLSSRRGLLGRPTEPRQPRSRLGRPVAAGRRPTPCDRASCLRHRANRSRRPRPAPPAQSLHLGRSARALVPFGKRHRPRARPRSKSSIRPTPLTGSERNYASPRRG